jgi:putative ABC transport system permease protein
MIRLAWRNLVHDRTRLAISVGGIALAVVLILVVAGIFAGSEEHAVAYVKNQPAQLWAMQTGVENLHMSSSLIDAATVEAIQSQALVAEAVPLLYASAGVDLGDTVIYSYIFAVNDEAPFGGPWRIRTGVDRPAMDEVVIDGELADRYSLGLGDQVNILGADLMIAGLSEGTFGIATSITFVNQQALAAMMGISPQSASYVLVTPNPGGDVDQLLADLEAQVPGVNWMTTEAFIASDQEMIRQMGADVIRAMNLIAYVVGMLVIGLTIYIATLERAREYGVLKAVGAKGGQLIRLVFAQAIISAGLGILLGILAALGLAQLISRLFPEVLVIIEAEFVWQQLPLLALITTLGALLPIGRILSLDPLVVFRNG